MDSKTHNPAANVPRQTEDEPRGDRGQGNKTWAPQSDEQGISNRPGDGSRSTADHSGVSEPLTHEDVIETTIEREENRNAAAETQEAKSNLRRGRRSSR